MKRRLRSLLKLGLGTILFLSILWQFENWRGARAWKKTQERALNRGISLNLKDHLLPEIPGDENFMTDPVFLVEWNGEKEPILRDWELMDLPCFQENPRFRSVRLALGKTFSFTELYSKGLTDEEAEINLETDLKEISKRVEKVTQIILTYPRHRLPHLEIEEAHTPKLAPFFLPLKGLVNSLEDLAFLELRRGRPKDAFRRMKAIDRLAYAYSAPLMVDFLVSEAVNSLNIEILWEGLRLRSWDQKELEEIAALIRLREPHELFPNYLFTELSYGLNFVDHLDEFLKTVDEKFPSFAGETEDSITFGKIQRWLAINGPEGWQHQRRVDMSEPVLDIFDLPRPFTIAAIEKIMEKSVPSFSSRMIDFRWLEDVTSLLRKAQYHETQKQIALFAIALELRFLKNGVYPEKVDQDLNFVDASDPSRQFLRYRLDENGRPEVWSLFEESQESSPKMRKLAWRYSPFKN